MAVQHSIRQPEQVKTCARETGARHGGGPTRARTRRASARRPVSPVPTWPTARTFRCTTSSRWLAATSRADAVKHTSKCCFHLKIAARRTQKYVRRAAHTRVRHCGGEARVRTHVLQTSNGTCAATCHGAAGTRLTFGNRHSHHVRHLRQDGSNIGSWRGPRSMGPGGHFQPVGARHF